MSNGTLLARRFFLAADFSRTSNRTSIDDAQLEGPFIVQPHRHAAETIVKLMHVVASG
jgi:hypothetical protein